MHDDAEEVQRGVVVRPGLEDLPAQGLGLLQLAGMKVPYGGGQRRREGGACGGLAGRSCHIALLDMSLPASLLAIRRFSRTKPSPPI